ncbi:histone deacetylase 4-like [Anneissia japonica]|uniref:histone deacetylase 4-like n=1 Tax=Anneissia japonica TaxID=1529436 RepID=UPI00142587B8|nr:histone deacetylase 4-like [Anneissia japonica]
MPELCKPTEASMLNVDNTRSANNLKRRSERRVRFSDTAISGSQREVNTHYKMHMKAAAQNNPLSPEAARRSMHLTQAQQARSEQELQLELMELQKQQHIQQQVLMEKFKHQSDQLVKDYHKQQQQIISQIQQQKILEQQARLDQQRNQMIVKKDKPNTNPSIAVKRKLQDFVLNRQQRELANFNHSPPYTWNPQNVSQHSPPHTAHYQTQVFGQYDNFPLRKTASDSNLKVRSKLKEKVAERRSHGSPLIRRKEHQNRKGKPLSVENSISSSSAPGSGPSSPQSIASLTENGNGGFIVHNEEVSAYPRLALQFKANASSVDLFPNHKLFHCIICIYVMENKVYGIESSKNIFTFSILYSQTTALGKRVIRSKGLAIGPSVHGHYITGPLQGTEMNSPFSGSNPSLVQTSLPTIPLVPNTVLHPMMGSLPFKDPNTCAITGSGGMAQRIIGPVHRPLVRTRSEPLPTNPSHQIQQLHQQQRLLLQQQQHQFHQQQQQLLQRHQAKKEASNYTLLHSNRVIERYVEEDEEEETAQQMQDIVKVKQEPVDSEEERIRLQQEQEELMKQQSLGPLTPSATTGEDLNSVHKPLSRARSLPSGTATSTFPRTKDDQQSRHEFTTGLAFDQLMLKHQCSCGNNAIHPEHPGRLQSIWARLHERGIVSECKQLQGRKATLEEIQSCHSEGYTLFYATNNLNRSRLDSSKLAIIPQLNFTLLPCGGLGVDSDTVWNDYNSSGAARMAVGCVTELAFKVSTGSLKNGFALVRPPGHHAEVSQAMGFCFFNNIAIAAKQLRKKLKLNKILIVDWDVHHGNSTQKLFYDDQHVLYISLHRHDEGNFFPGTGAADECGCGDGLGFNVNIAWHGGLDPPLGDVEYLAAFRSVVMPVAREFSPDVILVSAGFDAAPGHPNPLGGYNVSPVGFAYMTRQLMTLAGGRVVLVLEGGYNLTSICDAAEACANVLLGHDEPDLKVPKEVLEKRPCKNAVLCLQKTVQIQSEFWTSVRRKANIIACSAIEAAEKEREEMETVNAMASLSMQVKLEQPEDEPMDEGTIIEDAHEGDDDS